MQIRLIALKDELFDIEMETVEALAELISEFDRNYSEISEGNKANFSAFFGQVGGDARWWKHAEDMHDSSLSCWGSLRRICTTHHSAAGGLCGGFC